MNKIIMGPCFSCPWACGVDRSRNTGVCGAGSVPVVARIMLHPWEEPFLSGEKGAGTIFFSGCSLRCVFCQNGEISHLVRGREMEGPELLEWMFRLKDAGASNIELVTASHFTDSLIPVLKEARRSGLDLPVVWNSSAYENVETLRRLEGLVDIYLPDLKYLDRDLARRWSGAADYPDRARPAIEEMVRQTGPLVFQGDLLKRGTVVRHLVMPGQTADSQSILAWLSQRFGEDIFISIMNQYTPCGDLSAFPELTRRVTEEEYEEVIDFALVLGIENALIQSSESQTSEYTPDFSVFWDEEGSN